MPGAEVIAALLRVPMRYLLPAVLYCLLHRNYRGVS